MKRITSLLLIITILIVAVAAPSCPKKPNGETIKPSEILTAARSFAIFPVAIGATAEVIEVLRTDGDWKGEQAKKATKLLDDVQTKLDAAQSAIETGKLDQVESVRAGIGVALELLDAGIKDGTFNVKNATKQVYFSSLLTLARGIIANIYQIADALQPLPKELASARQQESLTAGGVAAIVSIAAGAVLEIKFIRDNTDVKVLWQQAKTKSAAVHDVLRGRL